ncbi:DUF5958 family protein [Siphonobacter curvatus]|uniref:Uncharacterized protein n=1 Tax=Siphonobacter curvatus TaxID=2094562 RepID=A0A2S7IPP2_9BACT|nr:DUF5958 family protein [Siphonobacter curvatus]PQA59671.1 hypothetical protein C5O19_08570 [Siphonobacter curvatus]
MTSYEALQLNLFAQGLLSVEILTECLMQWSESSQKALLSDLQLLIIQSKPKEEDIETAITNSRLKRTYTPCVVLKTYGVKTGITRIIELPRGELLKSYLLMLHLFQVAYLRRYELEKNNPNKWWYWDLSQSVNLERAKHVLGMS